MQSLQCATFCQCLAVHVQLFWVLRIRRPSLDEPCYSAGLCQLAELTELIYGHPPDVDRRNAS